MSQYFVSAVINKDDGFGEPDLFALELTPDVLDRLKRLHRLSQSCKNDYPKHDDFKGLTCSFDGVFVDVIAEYDEDKELFDGLNDNYRFFDELPESLKRLLPSDEVELVTVSVWADGYMYFSCSSTHGPAVYETHPMSIDNVLNLLEGKPAE